MNRFTRIFAAASAAALIAVLGAPSTASADVGPVKRVSCPSVAELNKLRPATAQEPVLTGLTATPTKCVYGVLGLFYDVGLTFGFSDQSTPKQVEDILRAYYDNQGLGYLFRPDPIPALGNEAFSWADASIFTSVNWQFSPGAVASMNSSLTWLTNAKVSAAKLFRPMMEVYTIDGERTVNGRQWRTTCEDYSATARCRTEIFATTIKRTSGGFQRVDDWVFNSLTYRWSNRALWRNNPLGLTGSWTSSDGRQWRTECDTPNTGRGACRSSILTTVYSYQSGKFVQSDMWVFNNQVLFNN